MKKNPPFLEEKTSFGFPSSQTDDDPVFLKKRFLLRHTDISTKNLSDLMQLLITYDP
jgi:hypothetical protein